MNILIAMAGMDTTDKETQYLKNLHEIENKIAFQHIYESLKNIPDAQFIVVVKHEDVMQCHIDEVVRLMIPDVRIVVSGGETQGAACSCLLAVDAIENEESLLIASSEYLVNRDWMEILRYFETQAYDAGVVTFESFHPKWSFVRLNEKQEVIEAAEKRPISKNATTGHYYFRSGKDFVDGTKSMIRKNATVKGKYYVCPVFNELVLMQKRIGCYAILQEEIFSLYTPRGIAAYEKYLQGNKT